MFATVIYYKPSNCKYMLRSYQ